MSKPQSLESARVMDDVGMKLLRAAEIIRERGLAKRTQCDDRGRVCVHGAISIAVHGEVYCESALEERVSDRLCAYLTATGAGDFTGGAANWNNKRKRTAAEVISALTSAAFQDGEGK